MGVLCVLEVPGILCTLEELAVSTATVVAVEAEVAGEVVAAEVEDVEVGEPTDFSGDEDVLAGVLADVDVGPADVAEIREWC